MDKFSILTLLMGVLLSVFVICQGAYIVKQSRDIGDLDAKLLSCALSLSAQQEEIEKYKVDMAKAEQEISKKESELAYEMSNKRVKIVEKLIKDPSCENRLNIISEELKSFLGVR